MMDKIIIYLFLLIATVSMDTVAQSLLPRKNLGVIVTDKPAGIRNPLKDFPTDSPSYKQKLHLEKTCSIYFYKKEYKKGKLINQENFTVWNHVKGKVYFEFLSTIKTNGTTDVLLFISTGDMLRSWHAPVINERWLWKFYQSPTKQGYQEYPIILIYSTNDVQKCSNIRLPISGNQQITKPLKHYFIYSYKIIQE